MDVENKYSKLIFLVKVLKFKSGIDFFDATVIVNNLREASKNRVQKMIKKDEKLANQKTQNLTKIT